MKQRCFAVALENTPTNVTCVHIRKGLQGCAQLKPGNLHAPRPSTRKALYIFLHECAHFVLHARSRKPRHVEEWEAERWAHERMRAAGLAVPREMTRRAKSYVAWKILQARVRGAKVISQEAINFSMRRA